MAKLQNLVIHTADIPFGRKLTPSDLTLWHVFPTKVGNEYLYKGKKYSSISQLPNDIYTINGVNTSIRDFPNSGRGWSQIGYSDMIDQNGVLINLVPYTFDDTVDSYEVTNGASGYNSNSRHIVLAGGWSKDGKRKSGIMAIRDVYSDDQISTLIDYIRMQKTIVPTLKIVGHNMLTNAKTCPNFDVLKFLQDFNV